MSDFIVGVTGRVPSGSGTLAARFAKPALLFAACVLACVAIALVEGKDFNWDFRNYHLYGPWALLHQRYDMDFMAGGPQGYLNPLGYLPLYLMATGGVDDRLAVTLLAAIHALCPFFTCLIANRLFASATTIVRYWLVAASGLLAMLAPVFWGLVGNTFIDPFVTALLLASLHACMRAADGSRGQWLASGLLFGLGLALKLTLLLFAPAMAIAVLVGLRWKRWTGAVWWALGAAAGALLAGGVSALALYRAYGSPTFPIFNAIFRSPLAATSATSAHERFIPDSAWEFLLRPLRMLDAHSMVYIENSAPEARLLVLFALLAAAAAWLFGRRVARRGQAGAGVLPRSGDLRAWWQFWGFFLAGWTCWLLGSGNGRYGLPLFLLAGPAIVALFRLLLPARFIAHAVLLLAAAQGFLLLSSFEHRWTQADWSGRWIEVDAPPVDRRAHGYILVDTNTNSAVFPFLDAGSGYFAIAGQMPQSALPALATRLDTFKQRWHGRLRLLYGVGERTPGRIPRPEIELLGLHGLRPADPGTTRDCSVIEARGDRSGRYLSYQRLLSCPLVAIPPDDAVRERQREFGKLFDRVAATCRLWFPAGSDNPPLPRAAGWERRYDPTDVTLFTLKGEVLLSRGDFGPFDVRLGSIEDWNAGRARKPDCRPLPRHYASDGVSFLR
jgi:hypothetical protein